MYFCGEKTYSDVRFHLCQTLKPVQVYKYVNTCTGVNSRANDAWMFLSTAGHSLRICVVMGLICAVSVQI